MGITDVLYCVIGTDGLEPTAVGFEFKAELSQVYSRIK